jgi:amidase
MTSRNLVIPVSEHQDTIGPMTRTVKDAAQILQAIAGVDPHDNYTDAIPGGIVPDFLAALNISALSGTRIGIPRNVLSLLSCTDTKPIVEAFDQTLGVLREAGAIIVENTNFTAAEERWNSDIPLEVINADFNANIRNYLNSLSYNPRNITSLAELREFTQSSSLEDFPDRDTGRWDRIIDQEWDNTDSRFWPAYQKNLFYGNEGGLLGAIERHDLDAVILPAIFASPWAAPTGAPIVTVPQGSFPANAPVVTSKRGLVEFAPNIPYVACLKK